MDELFGAQELDMSNLSESWKLGGSFTAYKITPDTVRDGRSMYFRHQGPQYQLVCPQPVQMVYLTKEQPTHQTSKRIPTCTVSRPPSHNVSIVGDSLSSGSTGTSNKY